MILFLNVLVKSTNPSPLPLLATLPCRQPAVNRSAALGSRGSQMSFGLQPGSSMKSPGESHVSSGQLLRAEGKCSVGALAPPHLSSRRGEQLHLPSTRKPLTAPPPGRSSCEARPGASLAPEGDHLTVLSRFWKGIAWVSSPVWRDAVSSQLRRAF